MSAPAKTTERTACSLPRSRVRLAVDGGTANVSGAHSQRDRWQSDKPNCHKSPGSPWLMLVARNQYKPGELTRWNFLFFCPPPLYLPFSTVMRADSDEEQTCISPTTSIQIQGAENSMSLPCKPDRHGAHASATSLHTSVQREGRRRRQTPPPAPSQTLS